MSDDEKWTDEDEARASFEALTLDHPSRVVTAFADLFHVEDRPVAMMEMFVTPEVRSDWGDFSDGDRFFRDQAIAISTRALRPEGAHDVAYVKLVPDDGVYLSENPRQDVLAFVTLVWRPELHGWRIHSIGQPAPAGMLPRTDDGHTAPQYGTDVHVTPIE